MTVNVTDTPAAIRPTDDMLRQILAGERPDWWVNDEPGGKHPELAGEPPQWWVDAMRADEKLWMRADIGKACRVKRVRELRNEHLRTGEVHKNALLPPDRPIGEVARYGDERPTGVNGHETRESGTPAWTAGAVRAWAQDNERMDPWFRGVTPHRSGRPLVNTPPEPVRRVA